MILEIMSFVLPEDIAGNYTDHSSNKEEDGIESGRLAIRGTIALDQTNTKASLCQILPSLNLLNHFQLILFYNNYNDL